jgi:hypothetical protein
MFAVWRYKRKRNQSFWREGYDLCDFFEDMAKQFGFKYVY